MECRTGTTTIKIIQQNDEDIVLLEHISEHDTWIAKVPIKEFISTVSKFLSHYEKEKK